MIVNPEKQFVQQTVTIDTRDLHLYPGYATVGEPFMAGEVERVTVEKRFSLNKEGDS